MLTLLKVSNGFAGQSGCWFRDQMPVGPVPVRTWSFIKGLMRLDARDHRHGLVAKKQILFVFKWFLSLTN